MFRAGNVSRPARPSGGFRKFFIPIGIIVIAFAIGSAFYIWSEKGSNGSKGEEAVNSGPRTLPKSWLAKYFLTEDENAPHVGGPNGDPDNDVLSNYLEYLYGTDPTKEDTDGDGDIDSYEIAFGKNPNGAGDLNLTADARSAARAYVETDERFSEFTEDKILGQVKEMFKPDQPVVLDLPQDQELIITKQNDIPAFEKYYSDTHGLTSVQEWEGEDIVNRLFEGMTPSEIDGYISRLEAAEKILKQTPVPSELLNIHKLKMASVRSASRLFELVRDNYQPGFANQQFWADVYASVVAIEQADTLQLAAWNDLGLKLKDTGGI